jgi:FkbM family methyltransferase
MLINVDRIVQALDGVTINGVLHVGAHDCEEDPFYKNNLKVSNVVWIDALEYKVESGKAKGHNVYHAVVTDQDDQEITFNVSNNVQSSSVLELKTHLTEHPWVHYVTKITQKSITLDTFLSRNGLNPEDYDFWNFDIQGAELMALKGATGALKYAKALYLEVNEKELYQNCAMMTEIDSFLSIHGFKRVLTEMTRHGWGDALYTRK